MADFFIWVAVVILTVRCGFLEKRIARIEARDAGLIARTDEAGARLQ